MPREEIPDPDSQDLFVCVRWLPRGEIPEGDHGYVQVGAFSEHRDREILTLLLTGQRLTSTLLTVSLAGQHPAAELRAEVREWNRRVDRFRAAAAGPYVSLRPDTIRRLTNILRKAGRHAWTEAERAEMVRRVRGQEVPPVP